MPRAPQLRTDKHQVIIECVAGRQGPGWVRGGGGIGGMSGVVMVRERGQGTGRERGVVSVRVPEEEGQGVGGRGDQCQGAWGRKGGG